MAWSRRNAPLVGLFVALAAAAALLIALCWEGTFFQDTWAILLERPGISTDSLLEPHNEHLVVLQVLLEKLLIEVFGMESFHPEMFVMIATVLAAAALLFFYVRRRVGPWPGLFAAVLVLFLGAGWQVALWPFEIEFTLPIAAGIGMLLLLDREDRGGDLWACLLLVLAIGFGSLGTSFILAAAVDVFLKRRSLGWGRAWIFLVPLVLYGAWYLGWGGDAESHFTLRNVLDSPGYVFEGAAAAVGSLSGLDRIGTGALAGAADPTWGRPLLIALIGLAIYAQWRRPGVARTFWPVAVAALSYWVFAAFNFFPGREPDSSRYMFAGAVFVILIAAELLRGWRLSPRALVVGAALTALALGPNLVQMKDGANFLRDQAVLTKVGTGAIEISRRTVDPEFRLTMDVIGTPSLINVTAESFLREADKHGSPGFTPAEMAATTSAGRRQADIALAFALPLSTSTEPGAFDPAGSRQGCVEVGGGEPREVELGSEAPRIELAPGPHASFSLRRFATGEFPVATSGGDGGSVVTFDLPADTAPQPWFVLVEASQPAWVCD